MLLKTSIASVNSKIHDFTFICLWGYINIGDFLFHQLPVKEVPMFLKLLTLKVIKIILNFKSCVFPHGLGNVWSRKFCQSWNFLPSLNVVIFFIWRLAGKAYLAQSPQLYKQMVLCADFDRVFTIGSGKTDRQTDRQTDRETDRKTDRQTNRQTDRQTERQTNRDKKESCCFWFSTLIVLIMAYSKSFILILSFPCWGQQHTPPLDRVHWPWYRDDFQWTLPWGQLFTRLILHHWSSYVMTDNENLS